MSAHQVVRGRRGPARALTAGTRLRPRMGTGGPAPDSQAVNRQTAGSSPNCGVRHRFWLPGTRPAGRPDARRPQSPNCGVRHRLWLPRLRRRWTSPRTPVVRYRALRRRTCRGVIFRAWAPAAVVIGPATARCTRPGRRASLRLIVMVSHVSMGGHFYRTVRGGHFYRPPRSQAGPPGQPLLPVLPWDPSGGSPEGASARAVSITTRRPG
jgi:hypothetical protein